MPARHDTGAERRPSGKTLEDRAELGGDGHGDDELHEPRDARTATDPDATTRRWSCVSEAGAPAEQRVGIGERAQADEHDPEDGRVDQDQRRRRDEVPAPRSQRVTGTPSLAGPRLHEGRLDLLYEIDGDREVALAVLAGSHADRDPAEDQEQEYEVHVRDAQEVCQPIAQRQR